MHKKLYRSKHDRIIAGVCGGIAEYFNVDSTLVRLALVFTFLFQGIGLIAYIICWIIISEQPQQNEYEMPDDYYIDNEGNKEKESKNNNSNYQAKQKQKESEIEYHKNNQEEKNNSSNRKNIFAVIMIIVGAIFLIDIWLPDIYWERYWPLMLIAVGVLLLKGDNND